MKRESKRNKRMAVEAAILKRELEPKEPVVNVKTGYENEDIPTSHIKTERDVVIENQNYKILGTTIKEEFDKVDMCETKTEKETVVPAVKEEPCSEREEDEIDLDSLPEIKTEELMLKCESDDNESGEKESKRSKQINIQATIIKQELEPKESIVCVKTECENEDIPIGHIKTERDVDIENHINKILGTTIKEQFVKVGMCERNTKKETVVPGVKEEPSSEREEDEIDMDSLPEIKTEELVLKNESDDSETGILCKNDMIDHTMTKVDKNPIKYHCCQFCDYRTDRKYSLKYHIQIKHDKNLIKQHGCDICDYRTHLKGDLTKHILVRHDKSSAKKHCCNLCDYCTHSKSNLKSHITYRHDKNLIKNCVCDFCDYKTNSKSTLRKHIKMKHDKNSIREHGCDFCDYRSHTKGTMKIHILIMHNKTSIKQHSCDFCDYKTHIKSHLNTHKRMKHDKDSIKKYSCESCDYKTHINRHLKNHRLKHDNNSIKKYGCDLCDYGAYRKNDLKRHIKKHHNMMSQTILLKHDVDVEEVS